MPAGKVHTHTQLLGCGDACREGADTQHVRACVGASLAVRAHATLSACGGLGGTRPTHTRHTMAPRRCCTAALWPAPQLGHPETGTGGAAAALTAHGTQWHRGTVAALTA